MPWRDWIRTVEVEPSLYAADFSNLGEQVEALLRTGARIFHFDVGDGHFVPPITAGPIVMKSIEATIHRMGGILDCHLMVADPAKQIPMAAEGGADNVTFHYEATTDHAALIRLAHEQEVQVGIAFNPSTSPDEVAAVAGDADIVLCMSIEPGYSGQELLPDAVERVRRLRELLPDKPIQVDGGIGPENIAGLYEAGATLLVAGTAIFEREDLPRAYRRLVQALA